MSGLGDIWRVIWHSLALDLNVWRDLTANPDDLRFRYAIAIVVLAGLAEAVSQSVVLFVNQVKPRRFFMSLFISAVIFTFGYFFYVFSIDLIATLVYDVPSKPDLLFKSVALAYAPLILGFLTLIPYFGRAVGIVLSTYHFLALLIAVAVTYNLAMPQPVVCVAGGWLLLTLLRGTVGRPITWLARVIRNRFAGTQLRSIKAIRQSYVEQQKREDEA